ncbi:MAG: hypothetical protein ACLPYZ_16070 [Limisphaerales bacterium]
MKPKLILCLALLLDGHCRAAIIYPKAPDGGREIVVTNVGPILGHDTRFFNGLKMEDLTVAEPYREYYVTNLAMLSSGHMLSATTSRSWRYMLMHGTNAVGAATLIYGGTNGSALKYNDVQRPYFPDAPLDALRAAEKLPQTKKQDYEVRALNIAPLNFKAVWLHGESDDIIIPLPPTFGRFNEYQPYSEAEIIRVLKKDAEDVIKHPNLLR